MSFLFTRRVCSGSLVSLLAFGLGPVAHADSTPVIHAQGTIHGFLELRSPDGRMVAAGEITQVVHGDRLTSRTLFKFKDGSVDDETTVYSQRRTFQLITDRHIQKGPYFPHPTDMLVDAHSGQVTLRTEGKDGKVDVKTDHLDLPTDLVNGLVPIVIENLRADAPVTTVSMVVLAPKPRVVKLVITSAGEETCSIVGVHRKASRYDIKIELGGVVGVIAPLIGKAPPNIQTWAIGGDAPTFIKESGPLYAEGPMMTMQLASPVWADSQRSGD